MSCSIPPASRRPRGARTIGLAAPLIAASIAATPAILGGRGGIDISVGPLMGFVNAIIVQALIADAGISSPLAVIPAALAVGVLAGALNGSSRLSCESSRSSRLSEPISFSPA